VAAAAGVPLLVVECVCSDAALHRRRLEARVRGLRGMAEVTWERVLERSAEFEPWPDGEALVVDSARPVDPAAVLGRLVRARGLR